MHISNLSRRQFITTSTLAAAALSAPRWAFSASVKEIPISLQLYSIRDDCAKNLDTALEWSAKIGFVGVEFAGYHKYQGKAKELREKLDSLKLKAAATHIGTGALKGDELKKTIEFHQIIGCKFLIVPGDGDFTKSDKNKALADTFNQAAQTLKPLDMYCGYHNHTHEFDKFEGKTYWDWFAERTTRDVVLQQDCGWTATAGYNPAEYIKKYPGRTKVTHFKPSVIKNEAGKKPILGQDSVDWKAVIAACREFGGTEWITVEQELYPDGKSPMECTELSLAGLKKLL